MDYKVEEIRALAERWLAGETSLAQEAVLRRWFAGMQEELPVDLRPLRSMFGQSAEAAGERSHRKLVLHTEPSHPSVKTGGNILPGSKVPGAAPSGRRLLRRWVAVASTAAAAVVVAMVAIFTPGPAPQSDILCVVNGVHITDPDQIASYTREALELASDNLRKPGEAISSELNSDPALARVGEMLNELSKNR